MSDWKDSSFEAGGRKYTIQFSDWDGRQLLDLGFDIYSPFQSNETLKALFERSPVLGEVLIYCCNISNDGREAFLKSLTQEVLEDARKAVKNAIANFTPAKARSNVLEQFAAMDKMIENPQLVSQNESTE